MEKITVQRTITEVTGYKANDGTFFKTEEECKKYEASAEAAVKKMFYDICVKVFDEGDKDPAFAECTIWESYGYGSEEYYYVIADIKSETELKIANMYCDMRCPKYGTKLSTDSIGKRVLIAIGSQYDECFTPYGTEEEIIEDFKKNLARFFRPEEKGDSK